MRVKIKREDILKGQPYQATSCPVALALKRRLPFASHISVTSNIITIDNKLYLVSDELKRRIFIFDTTKRMSQFTIDLTTTFKAIVP